MYYIYIYIVLFIIKSIFYDKYFLIYEIVVLMVSILSFSFDLFQVFYFQRQGLPVVLAVLELPMLTKMAWNSLSSASHCRVSAVIKSACHHAWQRLLS